MKNMGGVLTIDKVAESLMIPKLTLYMLVIEG